MALRMTEEEYAEFQRRHKQRIVQKPDYSGRAQAAPTCCQPARASGVSVAHLNGNDLEGVAKEIPPRVEHHDEIAAWPYMMQAAAIADDAEKKVKRSKYGNKRVEIDGIKFDSRHEANIYQELMLRVRAGELKTVCRQVKFDLPGGIVYVADFVTIRPDFSIEGVYDAKSPATKQNRVYINKKKQMKACWGIEIQEV